MHILETLYPLDLKSLRFNELEEKIEQKKRQIAACIYYATFFTLRNVLKGTLKRNQPTGSIYGKNIKHPKPDQPKAD